MQIKDTIEFIRKNGVLTAWDDSQIAIAIARAIEVNAFGFDLNKEGKLKSLIFGKWENKETVYIICAIGRGELRKYMAYLKKNFPLCKYIKAERFGKPVVYKIK